MDKYLRCSVVFNRENKMHTDLYEWVMSRTTNFSDFTRTVLFAYKQGHITASGTPQISGAPNMPVMGGSDADAMLGLLGD